MAYFFKIAVGDRVQIAAEIVAYHFDEQGDIKFLAKDIASTFTFDENQILSSLVLPEEDLSDGVQIHLDLVFRSTWIFKAYEDPVLHNEEEDIDLLWKNAPLHLLIGTSALDVMKQNEVQSVF